MKRSRLYPMVLTSLFTAFLCIIAPVAIPLPFSPIPVTLGSFAVAVAGIVLGWKRGILCVGLYLLMGCIGLPVFAHWVGGPQILLGPTGGYLLGYAGIAFCGGLAADRFPHRWYVYLLGLGIGFVFCWCMGTLWLSYSLHLTPLQTFGMGTLPFLPADLVKLAAAVTLAYPLRHKISRLSL